LRALFAGTRDRLQPRGDLVAGRNVHVGSVTTPLPPVPAGLKTYDCRYNRLLLVTLDQIRDAIEAAAQRFGRHRVAVVMGTSTSGMAEAGFAAMRRDGAWSGAFHYDQLATGGPAEFAARALGLPGPAYTVATACSSSGKVFASARRLIRAGICDAAVVGGANTLCGTTVGGFSSLEAMSAGLCNPFSANRDGINIGEAAAVFLLTAEDAPVRLLGVGESSDAHHVSAPAPEGRGALAAMQAALADAGPAPSDIAYVNLHGTATEWGDIAETTATHAVFGKRAPFHSLKSYFGHSLGACGALEAWLGIEMMRQGWFAHTVNLENVDERCAALDHVMGEGRRIETEFLMSNNFAFGGINTSLVFRRV
jgi:3-oxoacyl-[acyl-carrier-protein] synthase-1